MSRAVLIVFAAAAHLGGAVARAADCQIPPANASSLATTKDDVYIPKWCNQNVGPTLANGLHIDADDWTNGYGVDGNTNQATCNVTQFLTRLLNGAWIVKDVENYAIPFGQHRYVKSLGGNYADYDQGHWWEFASTVEPDEWEPECEPDDPKAAAVNHPGYGADDAYIGLTPNGAFLETAITRAAIIVHETTHEDVGHVADSKCAAKASCDTKYGDYNATTMEVNFAYDAAGSYVTQMYNGQPMRPVAVSPAGKCSYIPRFSSAERTEALTLAEDHLAQNFAQAEPPGTVHYASVAALDAANGTSPFDCKTCDLGKYTFDPNVCKQTACNEVLNPVNSGLNILNRIACATYNSSVDDDFVTPATVAAAKSKMQASLKSCQAPTDQAARSYCDAEKATAVSVFEVDGCKWLDTYSGPELAGHVGCLQEFCQEQFPNDGFGCLLYFCGEDSCGTSPGAQAACKDAYLATHADPQLYVPNCQLDSCMGQRAACLVELNKMDPPQWSYGEPIPAQCKAVFDVCEMTQTLATKVWTEYQPIVDPGPLGETIPDVLSTQPAKNWDRYVTAFRAAAARGDRPEELGRLARKLTAIPEMVAALYNMAPGEFVGLFGKEGFAEVLGPGIEGVAPKPFDEAKLTTAGRAALEELRRFLATVPGGRADGAIGKVGLEGERR